MAARGSAGAGGGGCGVVSAAPELDINKACGECKQRAEEVAMGVRGLRRTSTVGVVGDKIQEQQTGGHRQNTTTTSFLRLRVSGANERAEGDSLRT